MDVSILIVHFNTPGLLRQTLKGIKSSDLQVSHEIIVVDNNPNLKVADQIKTEFPEVKIIDSPVNLGFGQGMNQALKVAQGRYQFVFNPDIALFPGVVEELVRFMDQNPKVGMVGPQLCNPDRSVQPSCYRFAKSSTIVYRRLPLLRNLSKAKEAVDHYLMNDWDHNETQDVDYLLGAAILARAEAIEQVGQFDPNFFMYFEDQDWCRRFWKAGWQVVYHPGAKMVHYHRRETAEGGFIKQIRNPLTRIQMKSALYYYRKYRGEGNPRVEG
ncbi:glycosyltransferase family 2 protein [Patescibacteria group bacterium]